MTTVYMRNPHLTPKTRGPNSNRPKRLKIRGQKMARGIKKNWRAVVLVGIKFFF
jgi:hypothetical protein